MRVKIRLSTFRASNTIPWSSRHAAAIDIHTPRTTFHLPSRATNPCPPPKRPDPSLPCALHDGLSPAKGKDPRVVLALSQTLGLLSHALWLVDKVISSCGTRRRLRRLGTARVLVSKHVSRMVACATDPWMLHSRWQRPSRAVGY